jgi:ABC-type lipoprotein export system ATPase subunit
MRILQDEGADSRIVLRASGLWKSYDEGSVTVLKGVDFGCFQSRTVALCGPSGCGKSTLLHLLAGLDKPDRGQVWVNGVELTGGRGLLRLLRHEIGFVFQLHNLIPGLTLAENCMIPSFAAGAPRRQAQDRLRELAERVGLSHRLNHPIQKLSGGERQRTAICRALMNRPRILLADEPTGSLDEQNVHAVFNLLIELAAIEGATLLMATHDRALAAQCDRIVEMHDGRILKPAYAH